MCILIGAVAMASPIHIKTIPNIGQLPVTAVHRIYEDSRGYMWYGTVEGLCRDDGYNIITFRPHSRFGYLDTNNPVTSIAESPVGDIWFGTDDGCYVLHREGYYITPIDNGHFQNGIRTEVVGVGSNGNMYVGIPGKLIELYPSGEFVNKYDVPHMATLAKMCETSDGKIWFSTWGMPLMILDKTTDKLKTVVNTPAITCHVLARGGRKIWMGTDKGEIYIYDLTSQDDDAIKLCKSADNEAIFYMTQDDKDGDLWVTTSLGLHRYSGNPPIIEIGIEDDMLQGSMMLNEIIRDRRGDLWVSAFDRPSFCIEMKSSVPRHYPLAQISERFDNRASVIAMSEGKNGDIWFAHERSGLCFYDSDNGKVSYYCDFPEVAQLPLASIVEMTRSEDGSKTWVTPVKSSIVYQLQYSNGHIRLVNSIDITGLSGKHVKKLWEDRKGVLWIGTEKELFTYDVESETLHLVNDSIGNVSDIRESASGYIWIGTYDNGLWRTGPNGDLRRWQGTDRYGIVSVSPSLSGEVWFSTNEGALFMFSAKKMTVTPIYFDNAHVRSSINHIHVDSYGHVWLIENQKIIEYNPANGASHVYLTSEEGMPWRILPTSFYVDKKGDIFVGGIPGISSLTPSARLDYEASDIETVVSDVHIWGKSILIGDTTGVNSSDEIYLNPDDQYIDIYFSSLNHVHADKTKYSYRLKGFDKDWIMLEPGKNVASYTRLPHGTFILEVRSTDENDQWSTKVTTLKIHRLPTFFETWWFRMLIIMIAVGIIGLGLFVYIRSMKRKNEEIWEDSTEMIRMRDYIKSNGSDDPQYEEMNQILLEKAKSVIEANLSEIDFSVETLSQSMGMSRSTLTRKLKAATGLSPLEYIRSIKMSHAKAMLSSRGRNISDVAYALGYDNRKYFTSCFKNTFGMTPSEYQKSVLNDEKVD